MAVVTYSRTGLSIPWASRRGGAENEALAPGMGMREKGREGRLFPDNMPRKVNVLFGRPRTTPLAVSC